LKPFRLLHGVEVNIRANGTLDLPDETLAGLDWVVASIHAAFTTSPTERVLATLENPHVDCIGHLTGRKINKRAPMEVDLERVGELPVMAQVKPGEIRARLPQSPPDGPEPFEAVLSDLDEILLPGVTHWQHPRFFAYFATSGSEPGILAELLAATLNSV